MGEYRKVYQVRIKSLWTYFPMKNSKLPLLNYIFISHSIHRIKCIIYTGSSCIKLFRGSLIQVLVYCKTVCYRAL